MTTSVLFSCATKHVDSVLALTSSSGVDCQILDADAKAETTRLQLHLGKRPAAMTLSSGLKSMPDSNLRLLSQRILAEFDCLDGSQRKTRQRHDRG